MSNYVPISSKIFAVQITHQQSFALCLLVTKSPYFENICCHYYEANSMNLCKYVVFFVAFDMLCVERRLRSLNLSKKCIYYIATSSHRIDDRDEFARAIGGESRQRIGRPRKVFGAPREVLFRVGVLNIEPYHVFFEIARVFLGVSKRKNVAQYFVTDWNVVFVEAIDYFIDFVERLVVPFALRMNVMNQRHSTQWPLSRT